MDTEEVRAIVLRSVAQMAGVQLSELEDATTLESLGFDSTDAVVLAMEVERTIGVEIDVGLFFRCATIAEAASEIAKMPELQAAETRSLLASQP
jgi:acyl carrier protein